MFVFQNSPFLKYKGIVFLLSDSILMDISDFVALHKIFPYGNTIINKIKIKIRIAI